MELPMSGSGGGSGPAPFLIKTYEMIDDSSTDDIVSWSDTNASFVVWNPPEFAAKLLPTYFKHNNFSSFIRQLNTYGFHKIDPERWEFSNEDFLKDHKHLLKNIHRRKPIHSHSQVPGGASLVTDPERIALEEEIERLTREKAALSNNLWRFKQQQSGTEGQLEDLERRLLDMEERQAKMIAFLERAVGNPAFVNRLVKMAGDGAADFTVLHKRRKLPGLDCCLEIDNCGFYDGNNINNNGSCSNTPKHDAGQVFNQDFSDKLKLGLCPAASTQGSNERVESPIAEQSNRSGNGGGRLECLSFVPDAIELSDTGTSLCPRKSGLLSESADDGDEMILCQLNLTLASSPMQVDKSTHVSRSQNPMPGEGEIGNKEEDATATANRNLSNLQEATQTSKQAAPAKRVNDVFWEQFLTERPGSSDTEEASSSLRRDSCDEQAEDNKTENSSMLNNREEMEQLKL